MVHECGKLPGAWLLRIGWRDGTGLQAWRRWHYLTECRMTDPVTLTPVGRRAPLGSWFFFFFGVFAIILSSFLGTKITAAQMF